ncbi:hypothetical protein EJB05_45277, partial [Eragrostis curvula]
MDPRSSSALGSREVFAVKIDGNNGNGHALFSFQGGGGGTTNSTDSPRSPPPATVWRQGSYDFWTNNDDMKNQPSSKATTAEDPPTQLIRNFLREQAASGGEVSFDAHPTLDRDDAALQKPKGTSSSSSSGSVAAGDGPVPVISAAAAGAAGGGPLLRAKTRSRLVDPPPQMQTAPTTPRKSSVSPGGASPRPTRKSGHLFSGLMSSIKSKSSGPMDEHEHEEEEEEDPFLDEDIPDDFKRAKLDTLTLLQWVSLLLIISALLCSRTIRVLADRKVLGLHLWKWELLVFVLICGRLVSGCAIRAAVFGVERNFLLRKRVLYFVYGVRSAVQNALWLGLVLASWRLLFDKKVEQETHNTQVLPYVTKILLCFLVATLVRLVKTLLLKVLASSFHVSTYFDRIQVALFNQYVIEALSGPPLLVAEKHLLEEVQELQRAGATIPKELRGVVPKYKDVSGRQNNIRLSGNIVTPKEYSPGSKQLSREIIAGEGIPVDKLHRLNQKNVSAWNMKRLMRIVRFGTLKTMDEQIRQATGDRDESATQIRSEYEAKMAAKKIFQNVANPGSKYIYLSDLMRFMSQEEAIKAMNLFQGAQEQKRVSKKSLKNWVVNAFRDRKALALTLNDTKTAVNKLNQIANVVIGVIVFALWLLILGIATTHFFVFISSQLLVAVFVFGNTVKTVFEAIVFLFVMHPFDVGDRCEVEDVQMVVEEMNIMTTVFLRYDNLKIYYPNTVLATKPIMNYYRSPDMGEGIDFSIHVATPVEKLALMKERILRYIDNKEEHWYPGAMVVLRDVDDTNKLKVSIWLRHKLNFQDMGMRFVRRELVLQAMIKVLKDLEIEYRMLPQDVNVRNAPPIQSTRMPTTWSYP